MEIKLDRLHPEVAKIIRELSPDKIAKEIVSVQPMNGVNYIELMRALVHYHWICPCMAALNEKLGEE